MMAQGVGTRSVSVVMTVYNGEPYFGRGVASILAQSYRNFEFIIVDDGSTDGTPQRLRELEARDERVRVLRSGRLGFVAALNHGVNAASGEYIARQDIDDVSYADRLSLQVGFLDAHPDVGLVGGYCHVLDDNRGERYVRMPPTQHEDLVRAMARYIPFAHTLVMYRKAAWQQAGGYPPIEEGVEDLDLWITFASGGWRLASIPEILGQHWVHPSSFWHRAYDYPRRQRKLANLQWRAVRELKLPLWMGVYPAGRYVYGMLPTGLKRVVRRTLGGSRERDVIGTA